MPETGLRETKLPVIPLAGGLYALWRLSGSLLDWRADYARLLDLTLPELGCRKTEGPIIRLFYNDPALVPRGNRKWSLLIPIVPFDA